MILSGGEGSLMPIGGSTGSGGSLHPFEKYHIFDAYIFSHIALKV